MTTENQTPGATPGAASGEPAALPERGTPEYNKIMAERYEAQLAANKPAADATPPASNVPAKPAEGVDKFYDPKTGAYNWAAHVTDLNYRAEQAKKGATPEAKPGETPPPAAEQKPAEGEDAAKKAVEAAGLNWDNVTSEIQTTGQLSEASRASLEKVVPKAIIDDYLKMVEVSRQAVTNEAIAYAGGEQELNGLLQWAGATLPEAEKVQFNSLLASENWKVALNALNERRRSAAGMGKEPNLALPNGGSNPGGVGFASETEMIAAINDPKYRVDEAYRAQVRQKIALMRSDSVRVVA